MISIIIMLSFWFQKDTIEITVTGSKRALVCVLRVLVKFVGTSVAKRLPFQRRNKSSIDQHCEVVVLATKALAHIHTRVAQCARLLL